MRALIQRVSSAVVSVDGAEVSGVGRGLLVLLGVEAGDGRGDVEWLAAKTARLRIFPDGEGRMSRCVEEVGGGILVVSQFTLLASTVKGNRPSFLRAARPEEAVPLYTAFCERLEGLVGKAVGRGVFGADMQVGLVNDGPVTVWLDSRAPE